MASVQIYESSNGDTWDLVRRDQDVFVLKTPNRSSGGLAREIELGAFLSVDRHSAEVAALVQMIGSLAG